MSEHIMSIEAGKTRVLHTAGQYCDKDIMVTATGGDYEKGYQDGNAAGIEEGKQVQYDAFWDTHQQNGNRTDYSYAFAGEGWTDATFRPKYDIKPINGSNYIFSSSLLTDVVKLLNDCGIVFDYSQCTVTGYLAHTNKTIQTFPTVDTRSRNAINNFFYNCDSLRSIEKIILKDDGSQAFNTYSFALLPALEEIRFEGLIGKSLEIKGSPLLSNASVQSIIDCLKDLTGATAQTITFHADVKAKLTDEQKTVISNKNWILG